MRIAATYSHLNSVEYLIVHSNVLWQEVQEIIGGVDAFECKTNASGPKSVNRRSPYSPRAMCLAFKSRLSGCGWRQSGHNDWVTRNEQLARKTMTLPAREQRKIIEAAGEQALKNYNELNFIKERVAIEVRFGGCAHVAHDLFVKHMAFYVGNQIDVGIEVLPMESFQRHLSSQVAHYEGEFYNVIRQGRGAPAVPLVLIGIEP